MGKVTLFKSMLASSAFVRPGNDLKDSFIAITAKGSAPCTLSWNFEGVAIPPNDRDFRLEVRPRRKRHVRYVRGNTVTLVSCANERWSNDFTHGRLNLGRPIRALVVVDDFTRECFAISRGPVSRPIAFVESFNASVRKELLNTSWFDTLKLLAELRQMPGATSTTRFVRTDRWPT